MLTLSSYLDERSAKYKQEALGQICIAMAGSPPNCFHLLMEDIFGYREVDEPAVISSGTASVPATVPAAATPLNIIASSLLPKNPAAFETTPDIGSGSEAPTGPRGASANAIPYSTCVKGILPSSDKRCWSHTGLADEYNHPLADDLYSCPFPTCGFQPRQNI